MLDYLPEDMDTVKGQNELLEDFGKGAFSLIIVEDMPDKDVAALVEKFEAVDHVETVLWYSSLADISVPKELLPDALYDEFNTDNATMMAVFFDRLTLRWMLFARSVPLQASSALFPECRRLLPI